MDEFRKKPLEGEWWLPHQPQDVFKGQLTIGMDNHGVLGLRGTEEDLRKLPMSETRATFFGRLTANYTYWIERPIGPPGRCGNGPVRRWMRRVHLAATRIDTSSGASTRPSGASTRSRRGGAPVSVSIISDISSPS